MSFSKLQCLNPKAQFPMIINAPMAGCATPGMATEVTKAGGFGFLGCIVDIAPGSPDVVKFESTLKAMRQRCEEDAMTATSQTPVGVGFITGSPSIGHFDETILPIVGKYKPAAVWLFAPDEEVNPHPSIISSLRTLDPKPKVFVQVGNLQAARWAVDHGADVLVCQGTDAGGHQFRRGMGVVSLVAAVKQMLKELGPPRNEIGIVAAGGIGNGEGVAAAMAMGVDGVVMGTRFTVAEESLYPEVKQQAVIEAKDGNRTFKSAFHDERVNSKIWGPLYDGRAILTDPNELDRVLSESDEDSEKFVSAWAGTGVGLVNKKQKSADIVKEVREEAAAAIRQLTSLFESTQ